MGRHRRRQHRTRPAVPPSLNPLTPHKEKFMIKIPVIVVIVLVVLAVLGKLRSR
ncbi:hypothetical protein [Nocardioides sp. B-3]|uniref:hypothetical protein n=1 Tax=Nocardioides sp. B-3 TaxID=2895565 RepID=UPI002152A988|nr:hypothetical protein [Nocardioides sp. B-3]UUZ59111.1 hypothetical protein LP418_24730 [Nocardioides sp. B-3]